GRWGRRAVSLMTGGSDPAAAAPCSAYLLAALAVIAPSSFLRGGWPSSRVGVTQPRSVQAHRLRLLLRRRGLFARWRPGVGAYGRLPAFLGRLCRNWPGGVTGWLARRDSGLGVWWLGQRAGGDAGQCDDRRVAFDGGQLHAGAPGGGEQQRVI